MNPYQQVWMFRINQVPRVIAVCLSKALTEAAEQEQGLREGPVNRDRAQRFVAVRIATGMRLTC